MTNDQIASTFERVAELLEEQGANPFRVQAYRRAAGTLGELRGEVQEILRAEGIAGLLVLPGIGRSLAHAIEQLARSGRLGLLERLSGEHSAERMFATVANIGPKLAERIHEQLGIETLAELEAAAYDGRLAGVPGMGTKRLRAVRESLGGRFARRTVASAPGSSRQSREVAAKPRTPPATTGPTRPGVESRSQSGPQADPGPSSGETNDPPVEELLSVDREYRELAARGKLPRIAPRRFNPTGAAWLPILHTQREDRHYTALFSNTARAHELGTTRDWVVIYRDDDRSHGRWTVITARFGKLQGQRVVRGFEPASNEP